MWRDRSGPTTKLPSLGHITFDDMVAGYAEQAAALIEGGVDILLIETWQDLLQAKAVLVGIFDAMQKTGKRLPVHGASHAARPPGPCCWAPRSARR